MRVSIIGTGYVGIVTGVCLADRGHDVICVDVDRAKVDGINNGVPPIYELGLPELLEKHAGRNLVATTNLRQAVLDTDLTLVAVGTPFDGSTIDLSYIIGAAREIGAALRDKEGYHVVAIKSTVVPGTTDEVVLGCLEEASGKRAGLDFGVGMNPEFLTEGQAIDDFMEPDRIVLGGIDDRSIEVQAELYASFVDIPVVRTNTRTAEMIKYASNAMLATAISFSNELANLCHALGDIDAAEVMEGVHLSNYLSPRAADGSRIRAPLSSFYKSGCGFGGSCLPKDVKALVAHGQRLGLEMSLLDSVIRINLEQPLKTVAILDDHFSSLEGVRVAVLGLAFKPDTDDVRETPAVPIVNELLRRGAEVRVYDPIAGSAAARLFPSEAVEVGESLELTVDGADVVLIATRWAEFGDLVEILREGTDPPLVLDGRRMIGKGDVQRYAGVGYRPRDVAAATSAVALA